MSVSDPQIYQDLLYLYGPKIAPLAYERLENLLAEFQQKNPGLARLTTADRVSQRDSVLITYGDMVQEEGEAPLRTLADFLASHLANNISTVHVLPFYPYSSDDGFSVIDYQAVDPSLGEWEDVKQIGRYFRLMFDAVINHISAESAWFQGFLRNDPRYRDYFIVVEPETDLSLVFRPRTLPLLTKVEQASGQAEKTDRLVWTTFGADQIDLNFASPALLLDILETLLFYVGQGAEFIRLDAIAYLWKEIGTNCLHLPQTHRLIQLMRRLLDRVVPGVALITETNVPHEDNVSYFGDGLNEAQMVYNFSLPPLILHAFYSGNVMVLSRWAETLTLPSEEATFFNFLASHDGIGLTPLKGILSESAIQALARRVEMLGGRVSSKSNADGSTSPYELNINYLDALGDPQNDGEEYALIARRFLASQAIMLALRGVPGIYFHSLFGSRGWPAGVQVSGQARTINREKLQRSVLEEELDDTTSLRNQIFHSYRHLLTLRQATLAFHPKADQQVLFVHEAVFSLLRSLPAANSHLICLHNVSNQTHNVSINLTSLPIAGAARFLDLVGDSAYQAASGLLSLTILPYQVLWLQCL